MSGKYQESKQLNLPFIEENYLEKWEQEQTFEKSVEQREGSESFIFYEGPPSANGMPGIHHVISRTLKDLVCRYKTMQGFQVKRKAGWDTHGLPVELGVEKELGITREDIGTKISVEDYNKRCREAVMRYKDQWELLTKKMGYWVDLKNPYVTFDNKYIETLWWILKQLYDKDLLYKSVSVQPFSPAAGTGLSSHELNQPGCYRNVKDTTVVAMFLLSTARNVDGSGVHKHALNLVEIATQSWGHALPVHFIAWTTTPWTLPANCALTVGANIDYVLVKTFNPYTRQPANLILAKALISQHFQPEGENADFSDFSQDTKILPWQILWEGKGQELEGIRYEQLLPYDGNTRAVAGGDPWRIITGDFVTTEDGTGIVHTAPAFGADDFRVGKKNNTGMLIPVDRTGRFKPHFGFLSDRFVKNFRSDPEWKDVDVDIAVQLKQEGKAFKVEKYEHSYPHCWRTDKEVIYYPLDAWFIRTTAFKDRMIELNRNIQWKPASTGTGRFGNWLENMVDWNLSRSRFWGTPLPIWVNESGTEKKCIGSIRELLEEVKWANRKLNLNQLSDVLGKWDSAHQKLMQLTNKIGLTHTPSYLDVTDELDLHKPFVDQIILADKDGNAMYRESDLIDVWFDSGAMPYAQLHYPFEPHPKTELKNNFPADFIAEGVDQTRGWFYTLHALAVMLLDEVAYKTVVSNGLVLDRNGNKMSKRLGNAVDPFETIEKYGADATRWYLVTNASPWDSLRFDVQGIAEVQRKFFGTLFNTYQFFSLYANVDGFTFKERYIPLDQRPEIDQWILSTLNSLIRTTIECFDAYEPTTAARAIQHFVDEQLSNWYVRLGRRRFWKGSYEQDKICAYQTLYECLEKVSMLMAPVAPFFADWLFTNLNNTTGRLEAKSVHLCDFPLSESQAIDPELEERMNWAQDLSSLVLSIRKKENIRVRQPLQKILIPVVNPHIRQQLERVENLIKNEVNVREIQYIDESDVFVRKKIKPDYKVLGKKVGARMKAVAEAIGLLEQTEIRILEKGKKFSVLVEEDWIELSPEDVVITTEDIPGWALAHKDALTVALDLTITPELFEEGLAREFVNRIQKVRKDMNWELTDRIEVVFSAPHSLERAFMNFSSYICGEVLADKFESVPQLSTGTEMVINEDHLKVLISKKE